MTTELTLRRFDDMHAHFRLQPMLGHVLRHTAKYCGRAIAMPNTKPAILNGEDVRRYKQELDESWRAMPDKSPFEPLMTIEIRDSTTPETIKAAKAAGAIAGKVYPRGVTTNSETGLTDFASEKIRDVFRMMEERGMILLLHGELDKESIIVTKREEFFLPTLEQISKDFPKLKIVLEHVSSEAGVKMVKRLGRNVAATITAHHLELTLNDVIGSGIQPHNGCMPMPKDFRDRDALLEAATSGNPKFFLGSDSAPHLRANKECAKGACGVYSAPVLPSVLAGIFELQDRLHRLEDFTSRFGAEFYGLPLNEGKITLLREQWTVPEEIDGIVPYHAGKDLQWKLV